MKSDGRARITHYQPAAILKITGPDALSFLQGQFTQELRSGLPRAAMYGLWLNQKGKIIADSFVLRETAELLWVASYFSAGVVIKERLESYLIADDVVVEDVSAAWRGAVIWGDGAQAAVSAMLGGVTGAGEFMRSDAGFVFEGRRGVKSWEWLRPTGVAEANGAIEEVGIQELELCRIENAVPAVGRDVGAGDLPNEAGLEVEAVSYTKGCYLGQEVMARLKSMGRVRRGLVRVRGSGEVPGILPAALYAGEKRVGELRSAARVENGFVGLAMVSWLGLDAGAALRAEGDAEASIFLNPKTP